MSQGSLSRSSRNSELKPPPVLDSQELSTGRESNSPASVAQISELTTLRPKEEQTLVVYQDKRLEILSTLINAAESVIEHTGAMSSLHVELRQVQKDLQEKNDRMKK